MSVDTSRERIERLKATDSADYIHMALLDRAEAAEAEVERLREALTEIDALDPERHIDTCAETALRGLVLRMGKIARAALRNEEPKE
jgi:hypothetical protein